MKLMQRHNEVIELINFIQSVFKLSPQEINETHPAISQLSCFLIQSLPMMETKVQMKLPKCLAVFFSDSDGR